MICKLFPFHKAKNQSSPQNGQSNGRVAIQSAANPPMLYADVNRDLPGVMEVTRLQAMPDYIQ